MTQKSCYRRNYLYLTYSYNWPDMQEIISILELLIAAKYDIHRKDFVGSILVNITA